MPIRGVVSTLPDQRWTAAAERELQELRDEITRLREEVDELRRRG